MFLNNSKSLRKRIFSNTIFMFTKIIYKNENKKLYLKAPWWEQNRGTRGTYTSNNYTNIVLKVYKDGNEFKTEYRIYKNTEHRLTKNYSFKRIGKKCRFV